MRGRRVPLSTARAMMTDLIWTTGHDPIIGLERPVAISEVVKARAACRERPPWTAILAKAFALVAQESSPLRRVYLGFPLPHFYEYPTSVANITVERMLDGEPAVFNCLIKNPADEPLTQIGRAVRHARTAPIEEVKDCRRYISAGRWPWPVRRALFWLGYNIGRQRANYFGTFTLSSLADFGTEPMFGRLISTSFICYGPIDSTGKISIRMWFDHRTFDGGTASRALVRLEEILNGPIVAEMREVASATDVVAADARRAGSATRPG